jgi:DinB superfamily
MTATQQIAKHLRELYFGDNWTCSDFKTHLKDVTWQQATTQVQDFNTIATLVYHTGYYISRVLKVLQNSPLEAKDTESFIHPPIQSQQDWEQLLQQTWTDVEAFATLIEQLPDDILDKEFVSSKYGSYYRNLNGIIEHSHYHLGQIVIIKKLL